jgi:RNA polymerase sigma-70 factor (ECF subfamily)
MSPTELSINPAWAQGPRLTEAICAARPVGDSRLMAEAAAGSVEAFAELYDRYRGQAYRVALAVCRDAGRGQDAVQDGFLSAWKSCGSYRRQQGTVAAWLLTVVRHRAIDLMRRDERHDVHRAGEDELKHRPAVDDVYESAIRRDASHRLHASLALLPDAQQEVISLAYYGQLSHTEIASRLRLPAGTVKGRMRLGLQKLRAEIEPTAA